MGEVKVHLADGPTDVLVYLAGSPRSKFTSAWIAGAVAPDDAEEAHVTVALALRLLQDAGYVRRHSHTHWQVTESGVTAVREAVHSATAGAAVVTPSRADRRPHPDAMGASAHSTADEDEQQ